jgi:predicted ATP-dependent serine protease
MKEAAKLGFSTAVVPAGTKSEGAALALVQLRDIGELLVFGGAEPGRPGRGRLEP